MMTSALTSLDYPSIKARQKVVWASGDYARIGTMLQIVGESLAETMDLTPGAMTLDVASGNGNATLALARRGASVLSTDYVPELLERGRARAEAEGLRVGFEVADAEELPFANETFDAVASTFGVMFAPDQDRAASELLRVCRAGGRIGLANWTPDSFIGEVFRTLGRHLPPTGLHPPFRWGDRAWIDAKFGSAVASLAFEEKRFTFRAASPEEFVDEFRRYYGPIHKAFQALDAAGQAALEEALLTTIAGFNTASDGTARIPSAYAEIIMIKA